MYPPGTVVDSAGLCCQDFDGYHYEAQITSSVSVPYAVTCSCGGHFDGPGVSDLQQRTVVIAHELVESATDPFVQSNPAYGQVDNADEVWTFVGGGEVADMCAVQTDAYYVPPGSTYMVQRSYSNAAAKAHTEPCVPVPAADTYFNSFPSMSDSLAVVGSPKTVGVKIPIGQTKTIDVHLWSATPTATPWKVSVSDYASLYGGTSTLKLSLDKGTGKSGDVLKLTITALAADTNFGVSPFIIFSDMGAQENIAMGAVGQ